MDEKVAIATTAVTLTFAGMFQVVLAILIGLVIWKFLLHPIVNLASTNIMSFWNDVEKEASKIQQEKEPVREE